MVQEAQDRDLKILQKFSESHQKASPDAQDLSISNSSPETKAIVNSNNKISQCLITPEKDGDQENEDNASQALGCDSSPRPCIPLALFGNKNRRKKHLRRAWTFW